MKRLTLLIALCCCTPAAADISTAVSIVTADLARLPVSDQAHAVYFWLGDVPADARPAEVKAFSGHLQSISREAYIRLPALVDKDLLMLRADARAYGWPAEALRQLVKADPFFRGRVVAVQGKTLVDQHRVYWTGGKPYRGRWVYHEVPAVLVSARWFVWQTAIQADRKPGYYNFLGLKKRADFDRLIGFDETVFRAAKRSEYLDAVAFSGVSQQPRRIGIFPALEGRKYITFDPKAALAEFNPLRILDNTLKHDAEEIFGFLPNGFWVWYLSDDKGNQVDSAPDFIGPDKTSPSNDGRIHVGLSCVRCHYNKGFGGEKGIIDFEPHFRTMLAKLPLLSPDYRKLDEVYRLYLRNFKPSIEVDRMIHATAVLEATGLSAEEWAKQYAAIFERYDAGADLAEAATYFGCDDKSLLKILRDYAERTGQLDPVLGLFLTGKKIPRLQFHEVFPTLEHIVGQVNHENAHRNAADLLLAPADADARRLIVPVQQPRSP